jgi:magnesium-transporting ATPase (P-type)
MIGPAYSLTYMIPSSAYRDGTCTANSEWPSLAVQRAVGLLTIVLQFIIPILIITFAYISIVITLHRTIGAKNDARKSENPMDATRDNQMKRARMNVIKILLMVVISFTLCWLPNQVMYTMYNCGIDIDFTGTLYHFNVIAVFLNCCINPLIYAFRFDQFKKELFKQCLKMPDANAMSLSAHISVAGSDIGTRKGMHQSSISVASDGSSEVQQGNNGECINICYEEN